VLGPRQVGKSTLLSSLKPDLSLNLANPRVFRDFVGHPERLERELRAARPEVRTVFLDEVQRVPALLDVVQLFLDEHPGRFRFLLSGSSARKLRRGQANLLPGRIHVHQMHPLLACELGADFDLDRALAHGTLPGIHSEGDGALRAADLRSYADTYLREEIQAEALVRNLGGFSRLLDLMAASSGRILNVQAMCRQAGLWSSQASGANCSTGSRCCRWPIFWRSFPGRGRVRGRHPITRFRYRSNNGTVKAVSPWAGL